MPTLEQLEVFSDTVSLTTIFADHSHLKNGRAVSSLGFDSGEELKEAVMEAALIIWEESPEMDPELALRMAVREVTKQLSGDRELSDITVRNPPFRDETDKIQRISIFKAVRAFLEREEDL
jgi:23S rRNA A1618 N6-methylase RlmF